MLTHFVGVVVRRLLVAFILLCFVEAFEASGRVLPFPESRFLEVGGATFHVCLFAPSCTPRGKVLFVHGLGGSTFSWRYAPEYLLSQGWSLVLVDLPGFGYSSRKSVGSTEKQAERLWELLKTLEEEGHVPQQIPWFFVGHSMGGGVVFLMSMEHPERVAGTVLVAPAFGREGFRALQPLFASSLVRGFFSTLLRRTFLTPPRVRQLLASAYGRIPTEEEFLGYLKPLQEKGTSRALLTFFLNASRVRLSAFAGKPHPPFLVLLGAEDSWTKKDTERFLKTFPDASFLVIPGAAHCPMETHPKECFSPIREFFLNASGGCGQ